MSIQVTVSCPVCRQSLTYEHAESEAWGSIGLTDYGIVELTAHDKGSVIGPHMREHHADGSWEKVLRQRAANLAAMVKRLDDREARGLTPSPLRAAIRPITPRPE